MSSKFSIGQFCVGREGRAFVIAEIAQAHDGSLGMAHSFIDAVAETGADAIKFQTHIAEAESTRDEKFRVPLSGQDETRWDYWKRMSFSPEQWRGLARHAQDCGLVFLSSPFSVEAVSMLADIGMPAWKIGSGEVFDTLLMDAMARSPAPVLLSSGMSTYGEIDAAVSAVRGRGLPCAVFQCCTQYPTPLTEVGMNVIDELRSRFDCPIGLSDHSGTVFPALAAAATGVDLLELHVVFDRRMYGPDAKSSVTLKELAAICEANRAFATMRAHPVNKDEMAKRLTPLRELFSKSVTPRYHLPEGSLLTADMLTVKKPGVGIPAHRLAELVGRRLRHSVDPDRVLRWDDLEC